MNNSVVSEMWLIICERIVLGKVPNSSFAEVRMGHLIEPTDMEDEDEEQENGKEDERDGEECRVEGRRVSDQTHNQTHDDMTSCAQDTLSQCHVRH